MSSHFEGQRRTWERLGKEKPHWSVLAHDDYLPGRLKANEKAFWLSGVMDVDRVLANMGRVGMVPRGTVLELGCGVGRLTRALLAKGFSVNAYDISKPHLELAMENAPGAKCVHLDSDDAVDYMLPCDFAVSLLTLQHNPPELMARMLEGMLRVVKPHGHAYFQIPTLDGGDIGGDTFEMHHLPMRRVFEIVSAARMRPVDVFDDGMTGTWGRSSAFIVEGMACA